LAAGGKILGWAWEIDPGVPIKAVPLFSDNDRDERREHKLTKTAKLK
jgi:hypothetical protein